VERDPPGEEGYARMPYQGDFYFRIGEKWRLETRSNSGGQKGSRRGNVVVTFYRGGDYAPDIEKRT